VAEWTARADLVAALVSTMANHALRTGRWCLASKVVTAEPGNIVDKETHIFSVAIFKIIKI
jgi:hypothetical protein